MRSRLTTGQYRARCRLNSDDLHIRILLLQILADTGKRSACTDTSDEVIHLAIGLLVNLRSCRRVVRFDIRRIIKLSENDCTRRLRLQLVCLCNRTLHAILARRQYELCAISLEK